MPEPDVPLLAKCRYDLSADPSAPWEELSEAEQEGFAAEATQWLAAAAQVGLAPAPGPGPDEWGRPRRVLEQHAYEIVRAAADRAGARHELRLPDEASKDVVDAVLHTVGVLPPPPHPEPGRCPAMHPRDDGSWRQCSRAPHAPDTSHEDEDEDSHW